MTRRFAFLLLIAVAGCSTPPAVETVDEPDTGAATTTVPPAEAARPPEPEPAPPPEPPVDTRRITIAAVGDMMLGTDYPENILPDDDGVSFLAEVTPVLSSADLAFGNLEGVLVDGGEPGKKCSNPKALIGWNGTSRFR